MLKKAKLFLIFFIAALIAVALSACAVDIPSNAADALKSIAVKNGATAEITVGETFSPSNYTLIATLNDDSYFEVTMDRGMFNETELSALSSSGTYALTVNYSLNGISKSILFNVKVNERAVVLPQYTVTFVMPTYVGGAQYGKQINPVSVSGLTTPYIELNATDATYYDVEWYTTAGFLDGTLITFPMSITADITVYGKLVDARSYTVRYYQRVIGVNSADPNGDRAGTAFYSEPSVYINGESHRVDRAKAENKTGYAAPVWKIFNYDTSSFETISDYGYEVLIDDKYIAPDSRSNLHNDVVIDAVYTIQRYTITLQADTDDNPATGTGGYDVSFCIGQNPDGSGTATTYYYNQAISVSDIPMPNIFLREGKDMVWRGYTLAGVDKIYVTENLVLTAEYSTKTYAVRFYRAAEDGGALISTFAVTHASLLSDMVTATKPLPTLQSRSGYTYSWAYYTDSDGVSNNTAIISNEIGALAVTKAINVYETKTANSYTSTFKYGSVEIPVTNNTYAYASTVVFPTDAQRNAVLPQYDREWYVYKWYTDQVPTAQSVEIDISAETQRAGDTVYYLSIVDMRRLLVTVSVAGDKTQSGNPYSKTYAAVPFGGQVEVLSGDFSGFFQLRYEFDKLTTADGLVDLSTRLTFNDSFITTHSSRLSYIVVDGLYNYAFAVDMRVKTKVFDVSFFQSLKDAAATIIISYPFDYGTNPVDPVSRGDYDLADKDVDGVSYRFYGWYTAPDDATSYVANWGDVTITSALSFYAKWLPINEGTFGLVYSTVDGRLVSTGYIGAAREVTIASQYNGTPVVGVAKSTFIDEGSATSGENVTAVFLHTGITFIEDGAFTNCYSLQNIFVTDGTDGTAYQSFDGVLYKNLGSAYALVCYPRTKAPVGGSYTLAMGTTEVGYEAMAGYSGTSVSFGSFLNNIGKNAFALSRLTSVNLPSTLVSVADKAFSGVTNLSTVTATGGLADVVSFGRDVFSGTAWQNGLNGQIVLGGILIAYRGTASTTVLVEDNVRLIATGALANQTALRTLDTGNASSLEKISDDAFANCVNLTAVYLRPNRVVSLGPEGTAFDMTNPSLKIYVPAARLSMYVSDPGWETVGGSYFEALA